MSTPASKYLPFVMWLFPLSFFAYQFILRLWPGLMMHHIMTQFTIDASQFGVIAACYYYGYASMQIPVALFIERFGTRIIVCMFAVLCGLAMLLFTYSTNWYVACLSRLLIGAASAAGFLGVSKIITQWFPTTHYTKMISWSFSIGLIGAVYGGKPISLLIEAYPPQNVAITLAFISIAIGCSAYCVMGSPSHQKVENIAKEPLHLSDLKTILSSPQICLLALANLLMVGALEGFSDVWGVPYLMTAYAINKSNAAELISLIYCGMIFGGPLLALCSKKLGNYTVIASCGVGMSIAFTILLFNHHYHWWLLASLLFSIGTMCCYQIIVFAAGAKIAKPNHLGITIAFLNCINMLGGSFFHTVIGRLMDMFWTGKLDGNNIKQYSISTYQCALMFIPMCATVGAIMICLLGYYFKQQCSYMHKL